MKKLFWLLSTLFFVILVASCEKDDICVEGDTPLLVLEFFDHMDTSANKEVKALRIVGAGVDTPITTFSDRANLSKVSIPLRTDNDETTFYIITTSATNDDGLETGNIDTLTFAYNRVEDFKSRACGFIINYENLTSSQQTGTGNWILDTAVLRTSVQNSDSTHVKIFH